jgi:PKD repeat protein
MMPARFSSLPSFTAYPVNGSAPLAVQFYAMVPGVTGTFTWAFGDGSGSSDRDPLHVYTTPGTYTVSLSYTTSNSETESRWTFRSSVTKRNFIVVSGQGPASAAESVAGIQNIPDTSPFVMSAGTQSQAQYLGPAGVIQWTKPTASDGITGYVNTVGAKKVTIPAYPKFSTGIFPA